jgi:hypothetical protein
MDGFSPTLSFALELTDNLPTIAAMQGALGCRLDAIGQKVYRTVGKPNVGPT